MLSVTMRFFVALLVDGVLAGALYALVGVAFVVVYKSSRMMNFALGEWVMLGSRLTASGFHGLGLGLAGAFAFATAGMIALATVFSRFVLRPLVGGPLIALIMVTLGLGALIRGSAPVVFAGIPGGIPLPMSREPLVLHGISVAIERVVAAAVARASIVVVSWFFRASRTGVALRAIADDQQTAMAVGINVHRHFVLTWALAGVLSAIAGTLWTAVTAGGFSIVLVALKVFPIVIIGGLDSIAGSLAGGILVGVLESLAAGYLDPYVGGGFSSIASYLVLLAALFVRPYGLFGRS